MIPEVRNVPVVDGGGGEGMFGRFVNFGGSMGVQLLAGLFFFVLGMSGIDEAEKSSSTITTFKLIGCVIAVISILTESAYRLKQLRAASPAAQQTEDSRRPATG